MTAIEYREILAKLGVSIVGAAKLFGISRRQAQRLASGESPITGPISRLLRLAIKLNMSPEDIIGERQ